MREDSTTLTRGLSSARILILALLLAVAPARLTRADTDQTILTDTRSLLSTFYNIDNVHLEASNGVLFIQATVISEADRDAIIDLLNQFENVSRVDSDIKIEPWHIAQGADHQLERRLNQSLQNAAYQMRTEKLNARVFDGVVVLNGIIENHQQADQLLQVVKGSADASQIEDYLSIREPFEISDLKSNVLMAITASADPHRAFVVSYQDGRIKLGVPDEIDNRTFETMKAAALSVPGVEQVERFTI